jgi:CRP-like cAMP-binding protein
LGEPFLFAHRIQQHRMLGMSPEKKKTGRLRISSHEQARRAQQREQSLTAVEQLPYSRAQTARALGGISIATVQRIENLGLLDKIRLAGSPNGAVFHRVEQVRALARGEHGSAS